MEELKKKLTNHKRSYITLEKIKRTSICKNK